MDANIFSKANTIIEIFQLSQKLKSEGHDVAEVNRLASIRKKELVSASRASKKLERVLPKASAIAKHKTCVFMIDVRHLNSGILEFEGNKIVL